MKWLKDSISNCHIAALKEWRAGNAVWVCLRFTEYSKIAPWTSKHWMVCMLPNLLGWMLQSIGWALLQFGEGLRTARWLHVGYIKQDGMLWEFVPDWPEGKKPRYYPPLFFRGKHQPVERSETDRRSEL